MIAALLGGVSAIVCFGSVMVNPTSFEWLMRGDYGLHFLGWHMYRGAPWTWPIGATSLLMWPIGSSVGLTDAIPIAAMLLKPFDAVLPPIFQFIGPWLVLSFALQAVFGVLLMRLATPNPSVQLLGAAMLVLSPPLMFRVGHAALTAHWLILASLWLGLRPDTSAPSRRAAIWWAVICAVTAATQPYLLVMVAVLMLAAHARQVLCAPRRVLGIMLSAAVALAAGGVALWQSGSLMVPTDDGLTIGGFGAWSTNLLSFVMPTEGPTMFSPGLFKTANFEQYEGYAYLGAGTLVLAAIAVTVRLRHAVSIAWWQGRLQYVPLLLGLAFLTVMALGPRVHAGSVRVFTYDLSWWGPLLIFRTNGRMVWPVFYATTVLVLFAISRFRGRTAVVLLSIALTLQAIDVRGLAQRMADNGTFAFRDPLQSRFWRVVPPLYRQMVLMPPNICAHERGIDQTPFSLRAGIYRMEINAGVTARYDVRRAERYCQDMEHDVAQGRWSKDALYVVRSDLLAATKSQAGDALVCTAIDGFGVCVATETFARWSSEFDVIRARVPPPAEIQRFYATLSQTYRDVLGRAERPVEGPLERRLEGLMLYLGYRIEGCDAADAESRALARLTGSAERPLCPNPSVDHAPPPADQTYAFARKLAATLATAPAASGQVTAVDVEGEAVWLQSYVAQRIRGIRESDASAAVIAAVKGAAR